jgi:hypothetical protein
MRSRDGNHTFSLSISTVILLLCSLALDASEYLISYRYSVHDAILYNDSLEISKSMQKCKGKSSDYIIFELEDDEKNLRKIINTHNEEFINFIHKIGLNVEHQEKTSNYQNSSVTTLTLKTTCFKVDFNDIFVKISSLKQP